MASKPLGIVLALILVTGVAYAPVLSNDFVNYDDDLYITNNPHLRDGLSWEALGWAATTGYGANWFPLTWLTWLVEHELFGPTPPPVVFHATNLILHVGATLLLFFALRRMTRAPLRSAFVAALFALHPMHVESVAWAAERKDVLSALFWMLTMWTYARYVEQPSLGRYAWVPASLALGLLSKPMLVTLPFVLLLLDVWPLGRFHRPGGALRVHRRALVEKVPLLALAAVSSVVTLLVQQASGAVQDLAVFSLRARAANAAISYVLYLKKALLPTGLSVYYPHPGEEVSTPLALACAGGLAAVSVVVVRRLLQRPEHGYLAVGWFWFLGTLVPVIGLVQVGMQSMADRYTYLPYVGLAIAATWGVAELASRVHLPAPLRRVVPAAVLLALAAATHARAQVWSDSVRLFEQALLVTEGNSLARINLGIAYLEREELARAEEHLSEAARIAPGAVEAHRALGMLRRRQLRADDALEHYRTALRLDATDDRTHRELGNLFLTLGRVEDARTHLEEAVALAPGDPDNQTNLGLLHLEEGRFERAIERFATAVDLDPTHAQAHNNWGVALSSLGRFEEATEHFRRAVALRPDYLEARYGWGLSEIARGDVERGAAHLERALALDPDDAEIRLKLGEALASLGETERAAEHLARAAAAAPDDPAALHELGVRLARDGMLPLAVETFERAAAIAPSQAEIQLSLGMALASVGRIDEAVARYERAIDLRPDLAEAYNAWGVALASQGELEEAMRQFESALSRRPGFVDAHLNWGRALAERGDLDGALLHFEAAIELEPRSVEAHNNLGVFLARRGQLEAALESFRQALAIDPTDAQARQNHEALRRALTAR